MAIGSANADFFFIFKPHTLGDLLKINSQKKLTKNHPTVVIKAPGAVYLLIFKPHTWGDLLKINSRKKSQKSSHCGDLGSGRGFFCLFLSRIC